MFYVKYIWNNDHTSLSLSMYVLLTLSPFLIALTFPRSPCLSKSRFSGCGNCVFFMCRPFVFLLLPFIGPFFCIFWTFKEKWQPLLLSLAVGLSGGKHGVTVLFWSFLLDATLVSCQLFSLFLFPFSMWFFVFKTQLRNSAMCLCKCYPNIFLNKSVK